MYKISNIKHILGLVAFVLVVGGTSALAENSLPGDTLYPVKVGVNEPLGGLFAMTAEQKQAWQAKITARRLAEQKQQGIKSVTSNPEDQKLDVGTNTKSTNTPKQSNTTTTPATTITSPTPTNATPKKVNLVPSGDDDEDYDDDEDEDHDFDDSRYEDD